MTYMTHIVKHSALPMKAIILSKAGKRMDMTRKDRRVTLRTETRRMDRMSGESPSDGGRSLEIGVSQWPIPFSLGVVEIWRSREGGVNPDCTYAVPQ